MESDRVISSGEEANVSWLDREVRREKVRLAELVEQVDKQILAISDQSERVSELEQRLARLQAQLVQMPEVHEALQSSQTQVMGWLEQAKTEQRRRETAMEEQHRAEREHQARLLHQVHDQLDQQAKLPDAVAAAREEIAQVREAAMRLREEAAEAQRRLAQQDERIAALRLELPPMQERISKTEDALKAAKDVRDGHTTQLALLRDDVTRLMDETQVIHQVRDELTQEQAKQAEAFRRAEVERSKTLTDWGRRIDAYRQQQDTWTEQIRFFADQFERNRRTLREVPELSQQVSQQQDQLRQVQRLAEDQLRREAAEFRQEIERTLAKAVRQWELTRDELLGADDALGKRATELEANREKDVQVDTNLAHEIEQVREALDRHAERVFAATHELLDRFWRTLASSRNDLDALLGPKEG